MKESLFNKFVDNQGYLASSAIRGNRSLYYQLKAMLEAGEVVQIRRGLYRHLKLIESDGWGDVCQMIPEGVLCLYTAWQFHELTNTVSSKVHMAIPEKIKRVLPPFPPISLYYWKPIACSLGLVHARYQNENITVLDKHRSVCDAVRFRNKVGMDTTSEVLKSYLSSPDRNFPQLLEYARQLRIEKKISDYLNIMV
jgi:predicted transcriptional regulator of viral defense system